MGTRQPWLYGEVQLHTVASTPGFPDSFVGFAWPPIEAGRLGENDSN